MNNIIQQLFSQERECFWFHSYEFIPSLSVSLLENFVRFDGMLNEVSESFLSGQYQNMYKHGKKIKITVIVEYDYE